MTHFQIVRLQQRLPILEPLHGGRRKSGQLDGHRCSPSAGHTLIGQSSGERRILGHLTVAIVDETQSRLVNQFAVDVHLLAAALDDQRFFMVEQELRVVDASATA